MTIHCRVLIIAGLLASLQGGCDTYPRALPQGTTPSDPTNAAAFSHIPLPTPTTVRTGAGTPGAAYWQQQVDYRIEARLDMDPPAVSGRAWITYHNNSPDPLPYLWIHLEQNTLRRDSIGGRIRTSDDPDEVRGEPHPGMTVTGVYTGRSALPFTAYGTIGRIDLPTPVQPGQDTAFSIDWSFPISETHAIRMGIDSSPADGPVFELAQWFPAVAVYDDVHGWNTLPYIGGGEFYTNFGTYDVALTVPHDHLCFATGLLENQEDVLVPLQRERLKEAGTSDDIIVIRGGEEVNDPASRPPGNEPLTWRFHAEDVRTFAWASSRSFAWDAASLEIMDDGVPRRVLCQSAYPADAPPVWKESSAFIQHAIHFYSTMLVPYPYPQMTNIAGIEGGMEYPMIIFCASSDREGLFMVTDHEVAHNWFPMLINTDERRHAWMDEGFNTFVNGYSQLAFLGRKSRRGLLQPLVDDMATDDTQPIAIRHDLAADNTRYIFYRKPARGMFLLREYILGPERFDHAFQSYLQRWSFKSPQPADFYRCMEDASGADLSWFWRGWFQSTARLDQAVERVTHLPKDGDDEGMVEIQLVNRGTLIMPVVMDITFGDGSSDRLTLPAEIWMPGNRYTFRFLTTKTVSSVVIDPEQDFPDINRRNNTR